MKKSKYYTPQIEEFCVGFEVEVNLKIRNKNGKKSWYKEKFRISEENIKFTKYLLENEPENIRVKKLDKEDIEEVLGVKQLKGDDTELNFQLLLDNSEDFYEFDFDVEDNKLTIEKFKSFGSSHNSYTVFHGKIKNKTEFIKLLKQLDINYGI